MTAVIETAADAAAQGAVLVRPVGRAGVVLRRFVRNRGALAGGVVLLLLFLLAFVGPLVSPWDYAHIDYSALREGPSSAHWWGTNRIGQDVFAQTVRGLQKSLVIGLLVGFFSTVLASLVGACAGYFVSALTESAPEALMMTRLSLTLSNGNENQPGLKFGLTARSAPVWTVASTDIAASPRTSWP